jgi:lipopolysaccharide export system permease protein
MILRRYLFKEIISTVFSLLLVLVLIYLSHRLIRFLAEAGNGSLPSEYILQLLGLKLLMVLSILLPLTFFLAILLVLGRMYTDNEMTAMATCGVGTPFLLKNISILACFFALFVSALSFYLSPWAQQKQEDIRHTIRQQADFSGISAGKFQAFGRGQGVFYTESLDKEMQAMKNVYVIMEGKEKTTLLSAKKAYQIFEPETNARYVVLFDGQRYDGKAGHADMTLTQFEQHAILLSPQEYSRNTRLRAASVQALFKQADAKAYAELQMRLAAPISLILLSMLAVFIAYTTPRQGRYAKLFMAILIYFTYNNLLQIAQKWIERESISPWLGLWWVHGILIIMILILWYRRRRI